MASRQDTMMNPSIEELLDRAGSKFSLVTLSAMRARQINAYFNQLGEGLGAIVPPQVTSVARKPLSIAFEEIAGDKIVLARVPSETAPDETGGAAGVEAVEGAEQSGEGGEPDGAE
jgi:DNA-directed RNA polymerase subunit omega